jgi:hypothetical protein
MRFCDITSEIGAVENPMFECGDECGGDHRYITID